MLQLNEEEKTCISILTSGQQKVIERIIYQYVSDIESICTQKEFQTIVGILVNDFQRKDLNISNFKKHDSLATLVMYMEGGLASLLDRVNLPLQNSEIKRAVFLYIKQLIFDVINDPIKLSQAKQPEKPKFPLLTWFVENEKNFKTKKQMELMNILRSEGPLIIKFQEMPLQVPAKIDIVNIENLGTKEEKSAEKISQVDNTLADLDEYFLQTELSNNQKNAIVTLTSAFKSNVGVCVFNAGKNEKFIQTIALLKFLIPHEEMFKPFLIVSSPEKIAKWKIKLTSQMHFHPSEIIECLDQNHGGEDNLVMKETKVIVTTPSVLIKHLQALPESFLKTACGFISPAMFTKNDANSVMRWHKIRGQFSNFKKLPDETTLTEISTTHDLDIHTLKTFFYAEIIYGLLIDKGCIDKRGSSLEPLDDIDELELLFEEIPGISLQKEYIFEIINNIANNFAWSGLIFDDSNVIKKDNFIYLENLIRKAKSQHKLRIMFEEKVYDNTFDRIGIIDDFLNGVPSHLKGRFINSYKQDLIGLGKAINTIAKIEDEIDYNEKIILAAKDVLKVHDKYQTLRSYFKLHHLHCVDQKDLVNFPKVEHELIGWEPTQDQRNQYNGFEEEVIDELAFGFSFFKPYTSKKIRPTFISSKEILNCLQRLLDHPMLVTKKHEKLFKNGQYITGHYSYLLKVLEEEYGNDINNLIKESGKLSTLLRKLAVILKQDNKAKIVIVSEYSSAAAIIKLTIDKVFPDAKALFYNGRPCLLNEKNNIDECKIIILCPAGRKKSIYFDANYFIFFDELWLSASQDQFFNLVFNSKNQYKIIHKIHFFGNLSLEKKIHDVISEKKAWNQWITENKKSFHVSWFLERVVEFMFTTPFFEKDNDHLKVSGVVRDIKCTIKNNSQYIPGPYKRKNHDLVTPPDERQENSVKKLKHN